jgi:hypothetical protein
MQIITFDNNITSLGLKFDNCKVCSLKNNKTYQGIIKKVPFFMLKPNEITLADTTSTAKIPSYKKFTKLIGFSPQAHTLEMDREKGFKLAKLIGMTIPKTYSINNVKQAISILQKEEDLFVCKLDNNYSCQSSFVPRESNDEVTAFLKSNPKVTGITLQKKVEGTEISTEIWVNVYGQVINLNHTQEQKGLLDGNRGATTGCSYSIVWNVPETEWKTDPIGKFLVKDKTTKLIKDILQYVGPIDVNCIFDQYTNTTYFLEFTPRFGYSAIFAWWQLLLEDNPFEKLFKKNTDIIEAREDTCAYAYRIWLPPYPVEIEDEKLSEQFYKKALLGRVIADSKFIKYPDYAWLDVYKEDDYIKCAGVDGVICEVTGVGETINIKPLKNIKASDIGYRTDITLKDRYIHTQYFNYPSNSEDIQVLS